MRNKQLQRRQAIDCSSIKRLKLVWLLLLLIILGSSNGFSQLNLALNKTATASTQQSSTYSAGKAVDGNTGTQWRSNSETNPWLYIDLGATYAINRVYLSWSTYYGTAYQIQTSPNGTTWTTIATKTGQNGGTDDNTGLTGSGRYLRINITTRSNTSQGVQLIELQVYDNLAPSAPSGLGFSSATQTSFTLSWTASTDNSGVASYEVFKNGTSLGTTTATSFAVSGLACATTYDMSVKASDITGNVSAASAVLAVTTAGCTESNIALNKPVTVDSYATTYVGNYAVDGIKNNTTYRWISGNGWPHWIEIDLQGIYSIDQVKFWTGYGGTYNEPVDAYQIQIWNGVSWVNVISITGNTSSTVGHSFTAVSTTKVRLYATAGSASNLAIKLYEIEVYGNPATDTQVPSVPTGLASTDITTSSFTLTWAASTDNFGVTGYEVFSNGVSIGTTASTSFPVSGLSCGSSFAMTVRARDAAANWSAQSSVQNVITSSCQGSGGISITSIADATLRAGSYANTNFGNDTSLVVKNSGTTDYVRVAYLKFDLSSVSTVNSAVLKLYAYSIQAGTTPLTFTVVNDNSWTETGITYANQPTSMGSIISTFNNSSTGLVLIDATSTIQAKAGGILTIKVTSANNELANTFYSRQSVSQYKPTLIINDSQAPSTPSGLSSSNLTYNSFILSWTPSTDNIGVVSYEVFQNGVSVGTTTSNSKVISGLTANTTYSMTVKAKDVNNNVSSASTALNVTTNIADTQAPTTPGNLSTTNLSAYYLTLVWTASTDNYGVTGYEVYKDGALEGTTSSTSLFISSLSAATTYSLTVRAKDAAGNTSIMSSPISVTTLDATAQQFNPLIDPALVLRLDDQSPFFKDSAGTQVCLNGDPCGYWGDLSGKGHHAKAVVGKNKPVYRSSALNGKGGVDWIANVKQQFLTLGNPSDLSGLQNSNVTLFIVASTRASSSDAMLFAKSNGGSVILNVAMFGGRPSTYNSGNPGTPIKNNELFTYGVTYDPSVTEVNGLTRYFQNGSCRGSNIGNPLTDASNNISIGDFSSGTDWYSWNGLVYAVYMFNRTFSPFEMFKMDAFIRAKYSQVWPGSASSKMIIWDGNSISRDDKIVQLVAKDMNIPTEAIFNVSWGGKNFKQMNKYRAKDVDSLISSLPSGKELISVGWEMTNELTGSTPAQAYNLMLNYSSAVKGQGLKFVTGTCLPRCGSPALETARLTVNDLMRTDHTNIDALADPGSDPVMGTTTGACNTSLYGDGLHPTLKGDSIISPYFSNVLKSINGLKNKFNPYGIQKATDDGAILVYPNPAINFISIDLSKIAGDITNVTLTDLSGKVVYRNKISKVSSLTIPTVGFAKGIYILSVFNGTDLINKKLVLE